MLNVIEGQKLDFADILLLPRVNPHFNLHSRSEVSLLNSQGATPIIIANMDSLGTFAVASLVQEARLYVAILKDYSVADWQREITARHLDPSLLIPTVGTRDLPAEIAKINQLVNQYPTISMVCLDVANGYLQSVAHAVSALRHALPSSVKIIAGNVVESTGLLHLARAGADIIKVGIGSGGVCLTRDRTGIGFPQFSAISELAKLALENKVELISDGGITNPGDMVKAFAAGATYVMSGSYFAGHTELGTTFHGMSSDRSRSSRGENLSDYRASEGREVKLNDKGPLGHTLRTMLGGLRSACTYLGVTHLTNLPLANLQAIRVNHQLNRIAGVDAEGVASTKPIDI